MRLLPALAAMALAGAARADDGTRPSPPSYAAQTVPFDIAGVVAMGVGFALAPSHDTAGWTLAGIGAGVVAAGPSVVHIAHGHPGWGLLRFAVSAANVALGLPLAYAGTHRHIPSMEDCNLHPDNCGSPADTAGGLFAFAGTVLGVGATLFATGFGVAVDLLVHEDAPSPRDRVAAGVTLRIAPISAPAIPGRAATAPLLGLVGEF